MCTRTRDIHRVDGTRRMAVGDKVAFRVLRYVLFILGRFEGMHAPVVQKRAPAHLSLWVCVLACTRTESTKLRG